MRISAARLLGALVAAVVLLAPACAMAAAVKPHVSLLAIERQAMCVTCKVALDESQAPQADREREYILSADRPGRGRSGDQALARRPVRPNRARAAGAHGFDLAVYVVPLAVVLALLATILLLIPSWRRRARAQAASGANGGTLSPADAARLESDLARFD